MCSTAWSEPAEQGCEVEQMSCPKTACDVHGDGKRWCILADNYCKSVPGETFTNQGWMYCDENTPVYGSNFILIFAFFFKSIFYLIL